LFLLTLAGVYILLRLQLNLPPVSKTVPLTEATAPFRANLGPALGIALTIPLGFICYQLYYALYSPLRRFGFVSADRGGELMQYLSAGQKQIVTCAMDETLGPNHNTVEAAKRADLGARWHIALSDPLSPLPTRQTRRRWLRWSGWLELQPPVIATPGRQADDAHADPAPAVSPPISEDMRATWSDKHKHEAAQAAYRKRCWSNYYIASVLLDVASATETADEIRRQWMNVSDIYHGLGAARTAVVVGAIAGDLTDWGQIFFGAPRPPSSGHRPDRRLVVAAGVWRARDGGVGEPRAPAVVSVVGAATWLRATHGVLTEAAATQPSQRREQGLLTPERQAPAAGYRPWTAWRGRKPARPLPMRPPGSVPKLSPARRLGREEFDTPFKRGAKERSLRMVFDWESIHSDETTRVLEGFTHHELIDAVEIGGSGVLAQLTFGQVDARHDLQPFTVQRPKGRSRSAVIGRSQFEAFAAEFAADGLGEDAVSMERELVVAQAALDLGADALVTDSAFLLNAAPRGLVAPANPVSPQQALALTGLFLRSRADFHIDMDASFRWELSRHGFDWALARTLLPEGWRFFSACLASDPDLTGRLPYLGQAVLSRYAQALRARERVLIYARQGAGHGPVDEQLFYLDHAVLALGGAFDSVARVAHYVYGVGTDPRDAGWKRTGWLKRLRATEPQLADLVAGGEPAGDTVEIMALLRNTIHGEQLRPIRFSEAGRAPEDLGQLPQDDVQALSQAVARRGGLERWGIQTLDATTLFFAPDQLIDVLMTECHAALNALMAATDVLRLKGVDPAAVRTGPSAASGLTDEFTPASQHAIRCLAGL
jgi:hypothetical protein